ncbi:hypothetical protein [Sphingobacterium siyangense]|uniref:hypothetical protein n=1 Tax=Sphingobacterium siyangense TaxID=459529 RepID=UPI003DA4A902
MKLLKYVFLIEILGLFCLNASSQIRYNDRPNQELSQNSTLYRTKYDSTKNFVGILMYEYQGQTFTVRELRPTMVKYGFRGFVRNPLKSEFDESNVYYKDKRHPDRYSTPYEDLVNRTFYVKSCNQDKFYLELEDTKNNEIIYFMYNYELPSHFPFIVHGYFEKLQREMKGKVYYARSKRLNSYSTSYNETVDLNQVAFQATIGSEWAVIDVYVSQNSDKIPVEYRLKGEGREINVEGDKFYGAYFGEKEVFDRLKKEEGVKVFSDVLNHIYKIGMTKRAVRLALLSKPIDINTTEIGGNVSEQWVLEDNDYIYFENGILTAIQN